MINGGPWHGFPQQMQGGVMPSPVFGRDAVASTPQQGLGAAINPAPIVGPTPGPMAAPTAMQSAPAPSMQVQPQPNMHAAMPTREAIQPIANLGSKAMLKAPIFQNQQFMAAGGGAHKPHMARGKKLHVGPIHSSVAGRTDHLPMHVPSGSYVIPADIISAMGEGNTMAGFKHMRRVFGGTPYGSGSAPYGQSGGPYGEPLTRSGGGPAEDSEEGVPIIAAGGEYVLSPDEVRQGAGAGDLERGHRVLDEFVKRVRAETVKTLKNLPGPRKD